MARRPLLSDDQILARARSVFRERGYAARTQQIAGAVGLTWGAIARRFDDKRTLFTRAMQGPPCVSDLRDPQAAGEDLRGLLERLRSGLWQRWPLRLQHGLATATAGPDHEPDALFDALVAALEGQVRRGSLRSDVSSRVLAQVVVALMVGDVAQRFVAHERTLAADAAFIDGVVHLLSAPP